MKSYNYLLAEDIDRENLVSNEEFIDDAANYIFKRTDGEMDLTDPDEIYDEFMNRMRRHDVNEVDTISDLMYAQEADEESKEEMSRLFSTYDKMEMSTEDFGQKVLDYGEGILTAPSTLAGVFTGGSAKVASVAGQQATKALVRRALSSGLKAGAIESVIGAGQNVGQQATRMELDPEREFSGTELAITTAASAIPGVVIGGAQGARKASQVLEAQELERQAAEGLARANAQALDNADQTIKQASKDNPADVKEAEEIISELKPLVDETEKLDPLDPIRVKKGEEIKAGIETPEEFEIRLPPEKIQQLTAAILDLGKSVSRVKGQRITSAVARGLGEGTVPKEIFAEIMEKYNLSGRDVGLILEADMSSYGRAMQAMGQLKKNHYGRLTKLIDDARLISEETGVGRESANYMNELAVEGNITKLLNGLNKGERLRRTIMTSQPVTTVRNFFGGGARLTLDVFEDFIRASTNTLYNGLIKAAPRLADKFGLEPAEARSVFNSADIGKYLFNKPEAQLIADMFRDIDSEGYERFFQGFVDASVAGQKVGSGGFFEKTGNIFNFLNKASDNFYKKAAFAGELSRLVKARYGKELVDVIKDGEFNKIDPKIFNEAMDKGFELLYQKTPKGTGALARGARGYLNFDKQYGFLTGLLIPFPRFVINQIQFMYEHVPVVGMLPLEKIGAKPGTKISYSDKFAKTVTGAAMMHYFYAFRETQGPGTKWYEAVDEEGNKADLRPLLGPMNLELYMADLMYRSHKYGIDQPMPQFGDITREVIQTAVGSSLRAGTGLYLIDQAIPEMLNAFDGERPTQQFNKIAGRVLGDYMNTYTLMWPVAVARDMYSLTDEELRQIPNTTQGINILDIIGLRASRSLGPFVGVDEKRYDILSTKPLRKKDPLRTAVTGLNISQKSNAVQKEANRLQIEPYEIYRSFKFGPADARIRRDVSQRLEPLMLSFIRTKEYQSLSDEEKTLQFLKKAKGIIAENYQPTLQILAEEAREMQEGGISDEIIKKVLGYNENDINQFKYENMPRRVQRAVETQLGAPTDDSSYTEYLRLAEGKKGMELASGGLVQKFAIGGMPIPMDEQMDALSLSETGIGEEAEETQSLSGILSKVAEVGGDVWENMNYLDRAALVTAPVPVVGDVTGLLADAYMYATKPEERTALNYSLTGAGVLGGLPASVTSAIGSSPALLGIFGAANPELRKRYEDILNAPLTKEQENVIAENPSAIADIMEEKAKEAYQETGVFKQSDIGMDQIPRIEFDDSKAELLDAGVIDKLQNVSSSELTVGDILKYDDLFEAYPEAKNIQIVPHKIKGDESYGGSFAQPTKSNPRGGISINPRMNPDQVRSVILHELQHYVQFADYLHRGANKNEFLPAGINQVENVLQAQTNKFSNMLMTTATPEGLSLAGELKLKLKLRNSKPSEVINDVMRYISPTGTTIEKSKVARDAVAELEKLIGKETTDEIIAHANKVKQLNTVKERAFNNYLSASGEVEARFTQSRRNMTFEERMQEIPNVSLFFDSEYPAVFNRHKTTLGATRTDKDYIEDITDNYLSELNKQNESMIKLAEELGLDDVARGIKETMRIQNETKQIVPGANRSMSEGANIYDDFGTTPDTFEDAKKAWLKRTGKKPNTDVSERITEMEEAAKKVKAGELDVKEFRKIADQYKPVKVWEDVPEMATFEDMFFALDERKRKAPFIGYNKSIEEGTRLESRLDIPAYTGSDTWVVSLKGPKSVEGGKTMYAPAVRLKNVDLAQSSANQGKALRVASGAGKGPFAVLKGDYVESTAEDAYNLAKEAINSDEWIQVGYDPTRRGYFYDRKTMEPVLNAEEIVQVGALVLAKKAVKGDPKDFTFKKGGLMSRK